MQKPACLSPNCQQRHRLAAPPFARPFCASLDSRGLGARPPPSPMHQQLAQPLVYRECHSAQFHNPGSISFSNTATYCLSSQADQSSRIRSTPLYSIPCRCSVRCASTKPTSIIRQMPGKRNLQVHIACAEIRRRLENMRSMLHERSYSLSN